MDIKFLRKITDLPNAAYHKHPAISATGLKKILSSSLLHYKYERENPKEQTPAMTFGAAYHCYLLTPGRFATEYAIFNPNDRPEPGKNLNSTANKAWKDSFLEEAKSFNFTVIGTEDMAVMEAMKQSAMSNENIAYLLSDGIAEASLFAGIDGVETRVRPDYYSRKAIIDLKTTTDASPDGFGRQSAGNRYHVQAALYSDVVAAEMGENVPFVFLAQEKEPPYAAQLYIVPDEVLAQGRAEYRAALRAYWSAVITDYWPGYEDAMRAGGMRDLAFPAWAFREVAL